MTYTQPNVPPVHPALQQSPIMFGQVPETQYDLHFSLFGIPVRIHPAFFLVGVIFGWSPAAAQFLRTTPLILALVFVAVLFVSILIHELGHALTAWYFGWPPRIVLYHFGGLAIYSPSWGFTRTKSVLISLAGPGAGFVLYGVVRAVDYFIQQKYGNTYYRQHPLVDDFIVQMRYVNLWWGLVNLLPVFPLDGGHVAEEILKGRNPHRGMEWTLKLGVVAGAVTAGVFAYLAHQRGGGYYPAILFGILAANNFQMLEAYKGRGGGYW